MLGQKLAPLVMMQGAASRLWPDPVAAIAATKLLTPRRARTAVRDALTAVAAPTTMVTVP